MEEEQLNHLIELCESLLQSADNTGCSEDLTVVSQEALNQIEDFIVNFCDKEK